MRYRWPNDAQCAVVLSFDVDAESGYVFRFPKEAATSSTRWRSGASGSARACRGSCACWRSTSLPATFFVPGYTIEHHTKAVEAIHAAGYEMGCHGNVHETLDTLDEAAERRILQRAARHLPEHLGIRPIGYRSPSWSLNIRSPALLKEHGFLYDSSLMGDDIPYFVGTPHGELAEVPIQWLLDDAPFYRHVYGSTNAIAEPDRVIDLWIQEFQGMYHENGAFVLTMHPWISGRAGRLDGLERLIRAIKAEPGVWWATCQQVAEWQIETRQNLDVTVPIL